MAAPEIENLPAWAQVGVGIFMAVGTLGAMAVRFMAGKKEPEAPRHVALETAELADLTVIRAISPKLDDAIKAMQRLDDIEKGQAAIRVRQDRILELLERMDRQEEMRRIVREERHTQDGQGQTRRT